MYITILKANKSVIVKKLTELNELKEEVNEAIAEIEQHISDIDEAIRECQKRKEESAKLKAEAENDFISDFLEALSPLKEEAPVKVAKPSSREYDVYRYYMELESVDKTAEHFGLQTATVNHIINHVESYRKQ